MPGRTGQTQSNYMVMIRDWYQVPGLPPDLLQTVFGHRQVDPDVERAVLIFEYWNSSGIPRDYASRYTYEALQGHINRNNSRDFINLLILRGVVSDFFDLTRRNVDQNGQLRRFLIVDCGVLIETIRYYASFYGIDPKEFADGFFVGLGESFAAVAMGLLDMAKMIIRINKEFYLTLAIVPSDPTLALARLQGQVQIISQVFSSLVSFLDPTTVPARIMEVWNSWNTEFANHLENLEPFEAGKVLGRIAGDLWQLLTGLIAVAKLLRIAGRLARKFVPLLLAAVRTAAAEELPRIMDNIASLLAAIDKALVDGIPRVGTAVLRTLFPPEFLKAVGQKGSAFAAWMDLSVCMVPEPAYAAAMSGAKMRSPFAMMVSSQDKPLFMAALSEAVPLSEGEAPKLFSNAEVEAFLDRVFPEGAKFKDVPKARRVPIKPSNALTVQVRLAELAQLSKRIEQYLKTFIRRIAFEEFGKLYRAKAKFNAGQFGEIVHRVAKAEIQKLVGSASPGTKVFADDTLYKFVAEAKGWDPRLEAQFADSAKLLDEKASSFLYRRPDLWKVLKVDLKSVQDAEAYLKDRFGWKPTTRIGDLKPDALLVDTELSQVSNLDWTSSTKLQKFEKTWNQLFDGLGDFVKNGKFTGDWKDFQKAYRAAFKGDIPKDVQAALKDLQWHAERETVIRQAILGELLGDEWYVRSMEFLYDGLNTLFGEVAK